MSELPDLRPDLAAIAGTIPDGSRAHRTQVSPRSSISTGLSAPTGATSRSAILNAASQAASDSPGGKRTGVAASVAVEKKLAARDAMQAMGIFEATLTGVGRGPRRVIQIQAIFCLQTTRSGDLRPTPPGDERPRSHLRSTDPERPESEHPARSP